MDCNSRIITRFCLLLSLVCLSGCSGCSSSDPSAEGDTVVVLEQDDAEIAAARTQARQSVGQLLQALSNRTPQITTFAVKMRFDEGEHVEYMWLTDLRLENGMLVGIVNNEPTLLQNVHRGDTFAVSPVDIDDWMYMENGKMVGGYSIAVLRQRKTTQVIAKNAGDSTLQR